MKLNVPDKHCTYTQDDSGQSALHLAARHGFMDTVKVLLDHQASVTVTDLNGYTPLYLAASEGNYEAAKLIVVSPDCDANSSDKVQ